MIARLYRPLVIGLLPIALIACMNSGPTVAEEGATVPLGIDLGGSGPVAAAAPAEGHAPAPQHGAGMQMAHAGHSDAHGTGTVNSLDPTQHKVKDRPFVRLLQCCVPNCSLYVGHRQKS